MPIEKPPTRIRASSSDDYLSIHDMKREAADKTTVPFARYFLLTADFELDTTLQRMGIYTGAWVGAAYLLTAILLGLGARDGGHTWFFAGVIFFTIWDIGWLLADEKARDRSAKDMLESSTRARTYMSYFMTVYGAVLAFVLFQSTPDQRQNFIRFCNAAGIHASLFGIPFVLTGLSLFFFLIALSSNGSTDHSKAAPSTANITIVVWAAWAQKTATFTFMYAVSRLLYFSWQQANAGLR